MKYIRRNYPIPIIPPEMVPLYTDQTMITEQMNTLTDLTQRIETSLDSIRPYLEADGGNVRIQTITEDHIVKLEFLGACGTCPMSTMTFKAGVEEAIKKAVPEIRGIEVVNLTQ